MDITLALGGGGAKGNAHIGVLRRLEQEGFQIHAVAGTSFGGLVAVFYALGYSPDEIEKLFDALDQTHLYGHDLKDGPSLLGIAGGAKWLNGIIGSRTFADLKIPCLLTAADLKSGSEILLSEGSLVNAILATTAIPGIFPARKIGEWELVDGGVLDPVPVGPARSLAPKLPVVAVVLNERIGAPALSWNIPLPEYVPHVLLNRIGRLRYAQALDVFLRSSDIVSRAVAQYRLEVDQPEIIIRPQVSDIDILERINVRDVVRRGEQAVDSSLPELKRMFAWQNRLRRAIGV
ncbi:MAG TPA: patatin-like phospholipase family protein [Anaerolineales bacterium]|nr:patatin-like phospholipase family protein [Anaerolineales bacterium]